MSRTSPQWTRYPSLRRAASARVRQFGRHSSSLTTSLIVTHRIMFKGGRARRVGVPRRKASPLGDLGLFVIAEPPMEPVQFVLASCRGIPPSREAGSQELKHVSGCSCVDGRVRKQLFVACD